LELATSFTTCGSLLPPSLPLRRRWLWQVANDEQMPPFRSQGHPMSTFEITLRANAFYKTGREDASEIPDLEEVAQLARGRVAG
jgi:hypothetical protein